MHTIIREAIQQAYKENLIPRNVADATNPPTVKNKGMRPLTEAELQKFLKFVRNDRFYAAYVLAAATGLRRGELLGLCWDCLRFKRELHYSKARVIGIKGRHKIGRKY